MLAKAFSATVIGVEALIVEVEVDVASGLPAFTIVGLGDTAVQESRERVRSAIKNSGYPFPAARITVNLAPADLRKEGSSLDLPIALGLLAAQGVVSAERLAKVLLAGELALDGNLRSIDGAINIVLAALEKKFEVLLPPTNAGEAALIEAVQTFTPNNLQEAIEHLSGHKILPTAKATEHFEPEDQLDLADLKGQSAAKRALEIALAGHHNLLLIGPPGSGKTMLARRAISIRPPLNHQQALEVTRIHSSAGRAPRGLINQAPFRSPHHTVSDAGLIGGGSIPKPGEVSLAHHGILFLDELPEFSRKALEALRQPLEDGLVTISRARAAITYPAKFQLIAAMNPSPSGDWTDAADPAQRRYLAKLSGPLLDRIDLIIRVPKLTPDELTNALVGESSEIVRKRINFARQLMEKRQGLANSYLSGASLRKQTKLKPASESFIRMAAKQLNLSARGFDRILRVSRTIADLSNAETIEESHLAEAISYRKRDW